jgi:hypothetical protein
MQLFLKAEDPIRILQRFLLGRGDSSDLITISTAVNSWSELRDRIKEEEQLERESGSSTVGWDGLNVLMGRMVDLSYVAHRISMSLEPVEDTRDSSDSPPVTSSKDQENPRMSAKFGPWGKWKIKPESVSVCYCRIILIYVPRSFSDTLKKLHSDLQGLFEQKDELERELQRSYSKCMCDFCTALLNPRHFQMLLR